jgi:hypothetical protein
MRSRRGSRGLGTTGEDGRQWRGGYAASIISGEGKEEFGRTISRVTSDEESVVGLERNGPQVAVEHGDCEDHHC